MKRDVQMAPIIDIQNRIYTIRGFHVMLDNHLAELYQVETRVLNQAVKRNIERFPEPYRFGLTSKEWKLLDSQLPDDENHNTDLKSQIVISRGHGGRRKTPYAFTEQGVAMLSSVLKSEKAIKVSIQIMNAFVIMRRYILGNDALFQRLHKIELKQIETDHKFEQVFKALESHQKISEKGIFFDGQVFDAWIFVSDVIRSANKSIILIDNYIDDTVFTLFDKRKPGVKVTFYTNTISKQLLLDAQKHNSQYEPIEVVQMAAAHDRFLIIDATKLYHIGASLKDLGKKWFAFSRMDVGALEIINRINLIK